MAKSKYEHWTDGFKLNRSFLAHLHQVCPDHILNKEAYHVYAVDHAKKKWRYTGRVIDGKPERKMDIWKDEFLQMNVRNQLCKMEHLGILRRISPGLYCWDDAVVGYVDVSVAPFEERVAWSASR